MAEVRNFLFIMCDQLRWDYLSCYGHPTLETPHIDGLAERGIKFTNAYTQSPVCGPSRMSFYTGRYVSSHGSSWNFVPLRVGEQTLGDHLRPLGIRTALVGKTHMRADLAGMARLGIDDSSELGTLISECGFEPYEKDDGLHPTSNHDPNPVYDDYLRQHGYEGDNPWEDWANSAKGPNGELLSGWYLKNSHLQARVAAEHSETPYMTGRAMDFIEEAGDDPWCLHLSFIKPHWPYIAPAPYDTMYKPEDALPVVRDSSEKENPHPLYAAYMNRRVSQAFSDNEVRNSVMPAYMGLIKQIDDEMDRLFVFLEEQGRMDDTMIVFTSDHGDYLGDHWLGDKDLFHDPSVKIPLIVYDPREAADKTRGTTSDHLVEAVDIVPTFLDAAGGYPQPHIIDGCSLAPILHGESTEDWRKFVVSEYDHAFLETRIELNTPPRECWLRMIFDGRFKYVYSEGFRPMLFDLKSDPNELNDLGSDFAHEAECRRLEKLLFEWAMKPRQRVTIADRVLETVDVQRNISEMGILIGYGEIEDLADARGGWNSTFAEFNPIRSKTMKRLKVEPKQ